MESSATSPDTESPVFSSSESSAETVKTARIKTSGSVSSLAQKFEKGGDSVKSETEDVTECESMTEKEREKSQFVPENVTKDNSGISEISSVEDKVRLVMEETLQNLNQERNDVAVPKLSKIATEVVDQTIDSSVGQEVKVAKDSCHIAQHVMSLVDTNQGKHMQRIIQDNSQLPSEKQITNAVEERVAYFAEKISQSFQNSAASTTGMEKKAISETSREGAEKLISNSPVECTETKSQISLKDLEQSFVTALNIANSNAAIRKKTPKILTVPSIEITEASDQEDISLEVKGELNSEKNVDKAEVNSSAGNNLVESETKFVDDNAKEPLPSTSTSEGRDKSETTEERKAFFYISSSDVSAEPLSDSLQNSAELRQRTVNVEDRSESVRVQTTNEPKEPSCLCSKTIYKVISLTSYLVAALGFILYNMAHQGKVPNFYELVGLITAIIAGIIGTFSCFCFSFMEAFPRVPVPGYDRLTDTASANEENAQNPNEESPVTEREFSRQNGKASTSAGESSVRHRQAERRELSEKTEKLKQDVLGLLDSFSELIARLEPLDEVSEMESGALDSKLPQKGVKKTGVQC